MATPEENKASALEKAAENRLKASEAAAKGDKSKVEMYNKFAEQWVASASRYDTIIASKQKISDAQARLDELRKRINAQSVGQTTPLVAYGPIAVKKGQAEASDYAGKGSSSTPSPTPPTPAKPVPVTPPPPPVKTAPIDTVLFDEDDVPIQVMQDLIFENIGGQELINIARNDTINGQNIIYQPIKNLTSIQQEYNPNNIVALQATSDKYFQNFSIKFENKVPEEPTGPEGRHVYIDIATGNLVIEVVNLEIDEEIEVEITTSGTIYEADI